MHNNNILCIHNYYLNILYWNNVLHIMCNTSMVICIICIICIRSSTYICMHTYTSMYLCMHMYVCRLYAFRRLLRSVSREL